jgi:hypothetical protein
MASGLRTSNYRMARIRLRWHTIPPSVVVTGRLTSADMGRLEQACAPALVSDPLWLEIDLRGVTLTDPTAVALLRQMVARGAILTTLAGQIRLDLESAHGPPSLTRSSRW